jgi:hypothetical protein
MAKADSNKLTAGDVQDLAVAVEQLTEETRLLRMSLDELRDDVVWAARQVLAAGDAVLPGRLRRQCDPLAPDAGESAAAEPPPAIEHAMDDEAAETSPYCCDRPRLQWNGDPDAPGVACASCGYVIAENGSVVIWRDEPDETTMAETPAEPEQRQGQLF